MESEPRSPGTAASPAGSMSAALPRERLSRGLFVLPDALHRREPLLRIPLGLVLDPRDLRDRGLPHHRRGGPRHARRPHRAPDELGLRVRRGVRLARGPRLLRRRSGGARLLLGARGLSPPRAGWRRSSSSSAARCVWRASTSRPTSSDKKYFIGLPIPAAAGDDRDARARHPRAARSTASGWPACSRLTVILSYLMISTIRYRSFKDLDLKRRRPAWILPADRARLRGDRLPAGALAPGAHPRLRRLGPGGQARRPLPPQAPEPETGDRKSETDALTA